MAQKAKKGIYEKTITEMDGKETKKEFSIPLDKPITLDTFTNVGKKITVANKEYTIAPICISDLTIIDTNLLMLPILGNQDLDDIYFAINVTDAERKKVFFDVMEKYVKYNGTAVTEELAVEHNWSYKDIKVILKAWLEVSD